MQNMRPGAVRRPAVAGLFYPDSAATLGQAVDGLLAGARAWVAGTGTKAIIVPHATLSLSGPVAASAYARLRSLRPSVRRVVLIGPTHRVPFQGLALPGIAAYRTPLGDVPVDVPALGLLRALSGVRDFPQAHGTEHSLEIQLPFLQRVFAGFSLVPILVGDATADAVARALDTLWGGGETFIVVSSDLSHHKPYLVARNSDRRTAEAIEQLDERGIGPEEACGYVAIAGLLRAAKARGLAAERLDLRNSDDTVGSGGRGGGGDVVGYGAWAFAPGATVAA